MQNTEGYDGNDTFDPRSTEEKKNELQIRKLQVGGSEGKAEGQGKQTRKILSLFLSFNFCMPG